MKRRKEYLEIFPFLNAKMIHSLCNQEIFMRNFTIKTVVVSLSRLIGLFSSSAFLNGTSVCIQVGKNKRTLLIP